MSRNFLSMNEELHQGDFLLSNSQEYKAVLQEDGNFVVYGWKQVWATNTGGDSSINRLILQNDSNLILCKPKGTVWSTKTSTTDVKMCRLTLGNDGMLILNKDDDVVWRSTK